MTKADLVRVRTALENYAYYVSEYPETVSDEDEEDLAIAQQIIEEKLNETK